MVTKIAALERADRTLKRCAIAAVAATSVALAASAFHPYTDKIAATQTASLPIEAVLVSAQVNLLPPPVEASAVPRVEQASYVPTDARPQTLEAVYRELRPAQDNADGRAALEALSKYPAAKVKKAIYDVALARLAAEHRCLTEALYYEARGEGKKGQMAVAEVIFHRLRSRDYPHSICGVVHQGAASGHCQFAFACDSHRGVASRRDWAHSKRLAAMIISGRAALGDTTLDALYFHAASADWGDGLVKTVRIGNQIFYRDPRPHSRAS